MMVYKYPVKCCTRFIFKITKVEKNMREKDQVKKLCFFF
jgi:hypothetical protein